MAVYSYAIICKDEYLHDYQYLASNIETLRGVAKSLDKYHGRKQDCGPHRLIELKWEEGDTVLEGKHE